MTAASTNGDADLTPPAEETARPPRRVNVERLARSKSQLMPRPALLRLAGSNGTDSSTPSSQLPVSALSVLVGTDEICRAWECSTRYIERQHA
jgi:hypothetical protein